MYQTFTPVVEALKSPPGTKLTLKGWVRTRRDSKAGLSFIHLSDGSCFDVIQVVAPQDLAEYESVVLKLTSGCAIAATGTLVESQGKGQSVELQAESIELVGDVENPDTYPVPQKRHTFEYLREVAHLRPRTNTFGAVTRVRHCLSYHVHKFLHDRGFYYIHTPIITASDCEGAGEMFRVSTLDLVNLPKGEDGGVDFAEDFFGREAFLTVSGQLSVENFCCALSKVYTFGPTFRAENSNTSRHLAEFWMIEPEVAFCDLAGDADLAEEMLKYLFTAVLQERADDMKFFNDRIDKTVIETLEHVVESPFVRITYTEAIEALQAAKKKWEFEPKWGSDLQSEHERYLTEEVHKKPVIVTDYPKEIKAFYMRLNDDERTVAALDILVPRMGEIVGGSQR
ncbi:MAG: asparagine--tRNA ligase, partial [Phycisphaerales bacterium JB038]